MISINRVKIINQEQADELYRRLPKRSRLIFAVGMETGLRIGDILRIRNRDVANPLNVYTGRLGAVLPYRLSEWLYNELISRVDDEFPDNYIFSSSKRRKRSIHRTTYHRHIKAALVGLGFDCSAHSARKFHLAAEKALATLHREQESGERG